jgi:hypothetical protein
MAVNTHQVRAKAQAFVTALTKMGPKEREQQPTAQFAEDFNRLLVLAKEAAPEVDARLWPKPLEFSPRANMTEPGVRARYAEIETYARQVLDLVPYVPGFA